MLKSALLLATLGLTALITGCGPEEVATTDDTTLPCGGTPEACAELERNRQQLNTDPWPCAGTPEACGELESK